MRQVDETHIKAIINSDLNSTTRDIAEKLNVSHTCIQKKLKHLGYFKQNDLWILKTKKKIKRHHNSCSDSDDSGDKIIKQSKKPSSDSD